MANIVEGDDIRPPPHYREGGPPQVATADTARQGPRGGRVLIILMCSLVGIVVAFGLVQLMVTHGR
ncbi:MAG: hypothetical protein ABSG83_14420 [Roseiarcus sp.]|jgi:hypothetical protein